LRRGLAHALAAALALGAATAHSQSEPAFPQPAGRVSDFARVLSASGRERLEERLREIQERSGIQFAIVTVDSTSPLEPAQYKVELFERWGIGRRGQDDGLLLLVAVSEREVWFETGYGLEDALPDGLQARIAREVIVPRFRAGDYEAGVEAGVDAVVQVLRRAGRIGEAPGPRSRPRPPAGRVLALLLIFVLLVVISAARARRRRLGRRFPSWWWGGAFGSFGGGWSGGLGGRGSFGGRGGFGGFGGGRSGGGGGGAKW
jgi:uncharacterized protein